MHLAGLPAIGLAVTAGTVGAKAVGDFAGMLRSTLSGESDSASKVPSEASAQGSTPAQIRTALDQLEERIRTLLADAGLPSSGAMTLTQDVFDRVRVTGHPAAGQVEGLLTTHPEIGDRFRAIADALSTLSPQQRTGLPALRDDDGKPTFDLQLRDRSLVRNAA